MSSPTAKTAARVQNEPPEEVDVAVIGCGLGGLTAAAYLARLGLSVACFDPHYVAGGCTTQFARGREGAHYNFDVGLHYIGECHAEGRMTALLRGMGVEQAFEALDPEGLDVLHFPGLRFPVPADLGRYRDQLVALFPKETRGVDRYVDFVRQVGEVGAVMDRSGQRVNGRVLWHLLRRGRMLPFNQKNTIGAFLDTCTQDPLLRGVILGQNGDYALPPSEASALLHAGLAAHYFNGAYYPRGGGQAISDKIAAQIEAHGGVLCLRRGIAKVLIEDGRAVGVVTEPRRGESHTVRARAVLSNADLKATLLDLVGPEHLPSRLVTRTRDFTMARALFMTCVGVKGDLGELGLKNHNLWQFDAPDMDALYRRMDEAPEPTTVAAYVTSASMKDPSTPTHAPEGHQTLEVMTMAVGQPEHWGVRPEEVLARRYNNNPTYQRHKARVEAELLARLEALLPGVGARITFTESATPVTHSRYTRAADGTSYGIAATPAQFLDGRPSARGPLPGLTLCGASMRTGHGIVGVVYSGYVAAKVIGRALDRPVASVF